MMSPIPAYRRPEPPSTRMQRISFAPVLSATRSRDSCWITSLLLCLRASAVVRARTGVPHLTHTTTAGAHARAVHAPDGRPVPWRSPRRGPTDHGTRCLLRLLEHLDQPPTLARRQRPGLHDLHAVADARDVVLVVGLQLARAAEDLAVEAVLHAVLDLDDDGLLPLVADDQALTDLAVATAGQAGAAGHGLVDSGLVGGAHATPSFGATDRPSSRSRMIV